MHFGLKSTLAAVVLGILSPLAHAAVIVSTNFQGSGAIGLASTDSTGKVAALNWNNASGGNGGPIALNDSTGAASGITLSAFTTAPLGGPTTGDTDNSTPQKILFSGGLQVNFSTASFTLTGLSTAFSTYDLLVYYEAGNSFPNARQARITNSGGSPITYYAAGASNFATAYMLSNSTTAGTYGIGNYVQYSNLTDASQTVTFAFDSSPTTLVGFQVVGTAVPEPGSLGLLAFSGLALLRHRRRRE